MVPLFLLLAFTVLPSSYPGWRRHRDAARGRGVVLPKSVRGPGARPVVRMASLMHALLLLSAFCLPWCVSAQTSCGIQQADSRDGHVWLLCGSRELHVSSDNGASWQVRQIPAEFRLRTVAMLSPQRGFVAGDGGNILRTDDAGRTWRSVESPTRETLASIHFSGKSGWIAGWAGTILHSRDEGETWEPQNSGVQQGLESIFFADPEHGWAVGWVGTILRTEDGGRTWQSVRAGAELWSLDSVYFRDRQNGWIVGFGGQILRSRDGGLSWLRQESPVNSWLKSVVFDHAGHGWIAADTALLLSTDGGETWSVQPDQGVLFLHQVLRVRESVWAIGRFGFRKRG